MANMNVVVLAGNLTRDPEIRYTTNTGTAIGRLNLAVNRRTKKGESTDFISLKAIGKLAESANTYLHKGSGLLINGRLETGSYEKDGVRHYTTDIVIAEMQFLDRPQGVGGASTEADADDPIDDDDLPF